VTDWLDYLEKCLRPFTTSRISHWREQLTAEAESQILGQSLAIDLATGSITAKSLSEVLACLPAAEGDSCEDFAAALADHTGATFQSTFKATGARSTRLGRAIAAFDLYVRSYKNFSGKGLGADDTYQYRRSLQRAGGLPLDGVPDAAGAKGLIWVASLDELVEKFGDGSAFRRDVATDMADCLGLPEKMPLPDVLTAELVLITYPTSVSLEVWKPTSLDGYYIGGYYLSSEERSSWGKTHPCSGQPASMRERVHRSIGALSTGYRAWYIGSMKKPSDNRLGLLKAAEARWRSAARYV